MSNINFLFWNIYKKDLSDQIVNICMSKDIDILILAENVINEVSLIQNLNKNGTNYFPNNPLSQCKKVTVITKFHYSYVTPIYDSNRISIRRVNLPLSEEFLLAAVHLVDKSSHSSISQSDEAINIASDISRAEAATGIDRSMIVGDFNMNPFEDGMIKALGFHATMSSNVAKNISRVVQDRDYKFFYNPMWSLLGDLHKVSAGSYYYRRAEHISYEWNIFDQVLIRPSLIDNFIKGRLSILESDGFDSLLDNHGRPDKVRFSDHLPIFFSLSI